MSTGLWLLRAWRRIQDWRDPLHTGQSGRCSALQPRFGSMRCRIDSISAVSLPCGECLFQRFCHCFTAFIRNRR